MLILPDYGTPYILDSLIAPMIIKHCWMFDGPMNDFILSPITYLEETSGPAVKVRINNSEFWVPKSWYILITDLETLQIDTVPIESCTNTKHIAYSFCPDEVNLRTLDIRILDHSKHEVLVHPMINKGTAMIHPVGPAPTLSKKNLLQLSVIIGPHDLYKYIGSKVVGDIIS